MIEPSINHFLSFTPSIDKVILDTPSSLSLGMLRLDQIHPVISGNKWYKLKYNIEKALSNKANTLITYGGFYSNHLIATAAAAKAFGLKSSAIVRGLQGNKRLTPTLQACIELGMQLQFVSKEQYAQLKTTAGVASLLQRYPKAFVVPEGGNNELGIEGTKEIVSFIPEDYTHVAVSVGSGSTIAGIRQALKKELIVVGFIPMKQGKYLQEAPHLKTLNLTLFDEFHLGGFGKYQPELIYFMNRFYANNRIPLDIVYTGKMMLGLQQLIIQNYFPKSAKILCIHTGGLQGNVSVAGQLDFE